jgi:hypothetical protein
MKSTKAIILSTSILLAIITVVALLNQPPFITPPLVSVNDLKVEITTTKTTYHVGEIINGTVWLINNSDQPVLIDQISTAYITAGYSDPPDLHTSQIDIDYATSNPRKEILPWGRLGLIPFLYSASQSGTFEIRSYGAIKSVRVIALQYETPINPPAFWEAYSTNMELRIGGINLPNVINGAKDAGYDVLYQDYVYEWIPGKEPSNHQPRLCFPHPKAKASSWNTINTRT